MLSPAPRAAKNKLRFLLGLTPQAALCDRLLRQAESVALWTNAMKPQSSSSSLSSLANVRTGVYLNRHSLSPATRT